jgi:hypothetical protein
VALAGKRDALVTTGLVLAWPLPARGDQPALQSQRGRMGGTRLSTGRELAIQVKNLTTHANGPSGAVKCVGQGQYMQQELGSR